MRNWFDPEYIKMLLRKRKAFYEEHREEIDLNNFVVLRGACLITPILFVAIYILAGLMLRGWAATNYHYAFIPFCVLMLIYWFSNRKATSPGNTYTAHLCIIFELMVMIPCIFIDTFANVEGTAQFIPLLLVAMPTLFFIQSWIQVAVLVIIEIAFVAITIWLKKPFFAVSDTVLSVFALLFSFGVLYLMNETRMKTYELSGHYRQLSRRDSLSRVCNKNYFLEQAEEYLSLNNPETNCILIFMDVDDFKSINDTGGHELGDRVLSSIGELLLSSFRNEDIVGRYGGDEFIVLMKLKYPPRQQFIENKLSELRERLKDALRKRYDRNIEISMGAIYSSRDEVELVRLLELSDAVMYEAKKYKDTHYRVYPYEAPGSVGGGKTKKRKVLLRQG